MENKKCPLIKDNCCKTECSWFIEKLETSGQIELNFCAVRLLAITKYEEMQRTKK